MRASLQVNDNYKIAPRRNKNKIRVRHRIAFAACNADFVRHKRRRAIEFANGFNDHKAIPNGGCIICQAGKNPAAGFSLFHAGHNRGPVKPFVAAPRG